MSFLTAHFLHDGNDDLPIPTAPVLQAILSAYTRNGEHIIVGPDLCSAFEIDEFVNRLISDIEQFRREAKHALDIAQSRNQRPN